MKRALCITIAGSLALGIAQAATLGFTNAGSTRYATGFGDSSGNIDDGLIWGVVVDVAGNGFATSLWDSGFNYTGGNTVGISLPLQAGGLSDDVLYINGTVTSNLSAAADGAAAGVGRVNSITTATMIGLGGQNFGIIWFDRGIALGTASADGQKYGFISQGTNPAPAFVFPTSNAANVDYSLAFSGADPVKSATFVLGVPEPSVALLGLAGGLVFLRRRR